MRDRIYKVKEPKRLRLLVSQLRQEILDIVRARGNCSAAEIAYDLGVPHDTIYYHLRKLERAGLILKKGKRAAVRRHEAVYSIPGDELQIEYDLSGPRSVQLLIKMIRSLLRAARNDFIKGTHSRKARVKGKYRNLWGARMTAWLSRQEIAEIQQLLVRIEQIFRRSRKGRGTSLHAISWVIAPLEDKPLRSRPGKRVRQIHRPRNSSR